MRCPTDARAAHRFIKHHGARTQVGAQRLRQGRELVHRRCRTHDHRDVLTHPAASRSHQGFQAFGKLFRWGAVDGVVDAEGQHHQVHRLLRQLGCEAHQRVGHGSAGKAMGMPLHRPARTRVQGVRQVPREGFFMMGSAHTGHRRFTNGQHAQWLAFSLYASGERSGRWWQARRIALDAPPLRDQQGGKRQQRQIKRNVLHERSGSGERVDAPSGEAGEIRLAAFEECAERFLRLRRSEHLAKVHAFVRHLRFHRFQVRAAHQGLGGAYRRCRQ